MLIRGIADLGWVRARHAPPPSPKGESCFDAYLPQAISVVFSATVCEITLNAAGPEWITLPSSYLPRLLILPFTSLSPFLRPIPFQHFLPDLLSRS